jgi:hypothetical protein
LGSIQEAHSFAVSETNKKKTYYKTRIVLSKKKRGEDCNIDSYLILVQYRNSTRVTCNVKLTPISKDPMDIPTAEA